ncbi:MULTISPECIES: hypothetical protein [Pseudomonas]|uniref:hypothetical protein n=1 Tax=Pseudomonas TaxID=286 RepID=UPI0018A8D508|nr:hypothetical protein [Pseudomonas guariconensis]MBF8720289.1 hypothetical protein [Pseudomonas guariconensis]MBF8743729.1 hypothetical protein [Pseudomonas guariconensis]MBF8753232.1 hypothetical protein [Pseudomonas guariconensis]
MANNQDKGNQGDTNTGMGNNTGTGQQGGQGSGSGMPNPQKGGQQSDRKPEDKMNKDWDRSRESGSQGGQAGQGRTDKQNPSDRDRMGGQQSQSDTQQWDKNR